MMSLFLYFLNLIAKVADIFELTKNSLKKMQKKGTSPLIHEPVPGTYHSFSSSQPFSIAK